jgi:hypothetical protein
MKRFSALAWIESTGGPLILIEEALMPYWNGHSSSSHSSMTDYERACAISDYLGTIGVGPGHAVVLGEEPASTAWWHSSELDFSYLVRWVFAESEDEIIKALDTLSINSWERNDIEIKVAKEKLVLFDSAFPGYDIDTSISIQIPTGTYIVETLHYTPNAETSLILHRFVADQEH